MLVPSEKAYGMFFQMGGFKTLVKTPVIDSHRHVKSLHDC